MENEAMAARPASKGRKAVGVIAAIILVLVGLRFGLIGGLIGAALAGVSLKYFGVVSANSAWVSETKGVKTAKYVVLFVVLTIIAAAFFFVLTQ